MPKLLDFGLASVPRAPFDGSSSAVFRPGAAAGAAIVHGSAVSGLSRSGIAGTPLYLSPEALDGAPPDPSFDLWSASMVLFEAVVGFNPVHADTIERVFRNIRTFQVPEVGQFRPDSPPSLSLLLRDSLSIAPSDRPQTAERAWEPASNACARRSDADATACTVSRPRPL